MITHKYIYWRSKNSNERSEAYANVHLLVGFNQASLANFQQMADELRQTFPQATDDEICGGKVFKSSSVSGHTIITWGAHIPRGDYPGWHQKNGDDTEYSW